MSDIAEMINAYSDGVAVLRASLRCADVGQYDERPIPGKWSIREVVCHLADSEIVYADRMKRVLVEDDPMFFEADPELFRQTPGLRERCIDVELNVMAALRQHMIPILRSVDGNGFQRMGRHSHDGPMTLRTLLQRITDHIPHHVRFIDEKVAAMAH